MPLPGLLSLTGTYSEGTCPHPTAELIRSRFWAALPLPSLQNVDLTHANLSSAPPTWLFNAQKSWRTHQRPCASGQAMMMSSSGVVWRHLEAA